MKKLFFVMFFYAIIISVFFSNVNAAIIIPTGSSWEYTFDDPTGTLPDWRTTTGGWSTGNAPFGNKKGYNADFDWVTYWPVYEKLWLRTSIDLTSYDLSTIKWYLGVDNGFSLYANGNEVAKGYAEGYADRWEYSGSIPKDFLLNGINIIALKLEDTGGYTAFDMKVTQSPAPEPGTVYLLGMGLLGLLGFAKRKINLHR